MVKRATLQNGFGTKAFLGGKDARGLVVGWGDATTAVDESDPDGDPAARVGCSAAESGAGTGMADDAGVVVTTTLAVAVAAVGKGEDESPGEREQLGAASNRAKMSGRTGNPW